MGAAAPAAVAVAAAGVGPAPLLATHRSTPTSIVRSYRISSSSNFRLARRSSKGTRRAAGPVRVQARRGDGRQTRLVTRILSVPRRIDLYFSGKLYRQLVWSCISFATGFYAANVVSLSFGAIAVNDVVAAVFSVAFVEVVGWIYYGAEKVDLKLTFLNSFKMGVVAAFMVDALKLGG